MATLPCARCQGLHPVDEAPMRFVPHPNLRATVEHLCLPCQVRVLESLADVPGRTLALAVTKAKRDRLLARTEGW